MKDPLANLGILIVLLLQVRDSLGQLGTGVDEERDVMDECVGAAGPRPINSVFSPGRTDYATVDDINGGYCGNPITTPGIWWYLIGTGDVIKASSCHEQTEIKVKMSVFTGSCDNLRCVSGSEQPDYECPILKRENDLGEWSTSATAVNFESILGEQYFILVQQEELSQRGAVWISFRPLIIPKNDNCVDSIGPIPRDMRRIEATSVDATISSVPQGYCGGENVPSLYPGTWFQVMGTGGAVSVMACSQFNFDGYAFSVYNGADCNSLECVTGQYEVGVEDNERCSFGSAEIKRSLTKFTFDTKDLNRYYIYVHFARTRAEKPTADFRFFVDDGQNGEASSSIILFEESTMIDKSDKEDNDDGAGASNSDTGGNGKGESGSADTFYRSLVSFLVLLTSWMIRSF